MSITFLIPVYNKVKTVRNVYRLQTENFGDKKIKFYHMFNAIYGILKVKFNK